LKNFNKNSDKEMYLWQKRVLPTFLCTKNQSSVEKPLKTPLLFLFVNSKTRNSLNYISLLHCLKIDQFVSSTLNCELSATFPGFMHRLIHRICGKSPAPQRTLNNQDTQWVKRIIFIRLEQNLLTVLIAGWCQQKQATDLGMLP